jgi:thiol-disulfide isomerase/thioredoxin
MSIVIALLALSACPSFSTRLKLPAEPEEGFRPPMGGLFAGFKGLKKTNNLAALAEKNENRAFLAAPTAIEDAVFINCPQKNTLDEIFAARGAKLLLVDFFAFSCTNCIRAGKTIDDLHEKFKGHGLEVLAFARPEFKFEGEPDEVAAWIERNNVKYDVATDVKGTNWKNWKVTSWPTHFLVQKDKRSGHEGEYVVSYTKVGDRDSDQLYNEVIKILTPDGPRMAPMNSRGYTDVEIFLGDVHSKEEYWGWLLREDEGLQAGRPRRDRPREGCWNFSPTGQDHSLWNRLLPFLSYDKGYVDNCRCRL